MIQEGLNKRVKFNTAKTLKEKGFDKHGYLQDVWLGNKYEWRGKGKNKKSVEIPVFGLGSSSVLPTIADVVMWFFEKHKIWISVNATEELKSFWYEIRGVGRIWFTGKNCESPEESYEAAFEYALNNLI